MGLRFLQLVRAFQWGSQSIQICYRPRWGSGGARYEPEPSISKFSMGLDKGILYPGDPRADLDGGNVTETRPPCS
jgi:hypothetical protein